MKKSGEVKQAICDAVWTRQIDQMTTREVATEFDCSLAAARNILMSIYVGTSGDERFKPSEERGYGVLVHDGATFAYGSTDINNQGYGPRENQPKHYVWFSS